MPGIITLNYGGKFIIWTGIILGMGSANERRRYIVTPFLIGWAHPLIDPCLNHLLMAVLPKNFRGSSDICPMGFIYSVQICEISHQTFGPGHWKCATCPMIFVNTVMVITWPSVWSDKTMVTHRPWLLCTFAWSVHLSQEGVPPICSLSQGVPAVVPGVVPSVVNLS